jgi:hypothetical protein
MGRKSIAKAVFCLLARQKPVNFKTGSAIGVDVVSGRADRKNKHHIFPRALLHEADISSQRTNSIVNICFLPSALNIEIGKDPPHQYLSECGPKRELSSRLHSHLIPSSARDALGHRPLRVVFREYLDARSRLIAKEMEKAAGNIRLFAKRND